MVMATGTGNSQSLEGLTHDINLVVLMIRFILQDISWSMGGIMKVPKASSNNRFIVSI